MIERLTDDGALYVACNRLGSSYETPARPALLSGRFAFRKLARQLPPDLRGTVHAHADEPGAASCYLADRRDPNILRLAVSGDGFLAHVEEHSPAHADFACLPGC
jgi:hypothetical protein